jgi:flavodoxin
MRKIFKIILAIFAVLIVVVVGFAAAIFLNFSALTATGSETLTSTGASVGKALVVYDPGLSGAAKGVADKVASDLQADGYTVTLAGVRSETASDTTGYDIIVTGGPIYAGAPTSSIKDYLNNLSPDQGTSVGVFGSGSGSQEDSDVRYDQRRSYSAFRRRFLVERGCCKKSALAKTSTPALQIS